MNLRKSKETWALIVIWQIKSLLLQWENKLSGKKRYANNDWLRPMIRYIYENYKLEPGLTGVEIGVAGGGNAYSIMKYLPMKKLYLIDPYTYSMYVREGYKSNRQPEFDKVRNTALDLLAPFKDRVEFIRKESEEAIDAVPGNLDFVYVDGNHEYEYVKKDLEMYYVKVKPGGIFGGDNFESLLPDVARAVLEFTDKHGLKIYGGRSPVSFEWWVIKNEDQINTKTLSGIFSLTTGHKRRTHALSRSN